MRAKFQLKGSQEIRCSRRDILWCPVFTDQLAKQIVYNTPIDVQQVY